MKLSRRNFLQAIGLTSTTVMLGGFEVPKLWTPDSEIKKETTMNGFQAIPLSVNTNIPEEDPIIGFRISDGKIIRLSNLKKGELLNGKLPFPVGPNTKVFTENNLVMMDSRRILKAEF